MSDFSLLKSRLDSYKIKWIEKNGELIVENFSSGFSVGIMGPDKGNEYIVFGGKVWHFHFDEQKEAFSCFMSCLTMHCRLKVIRRGGMDCSVSMERNFGGKWESSSWTGYFFFPFWKKKSVHYLQNDLIPGAEWEKWSTKPSDIKC